MALILLLAIVAMAMVLLTGCIDADETFAFVDGRLLVLIFAMLGVGAALEHTGPVALISNTIVPYLGLLPGFLIFWAIYLLTSVLMKWSPTMRWRWLLRLWRLALQLIEVLIQGPWLWRSWLGRVRVLQRPSAIKPICWSMALVAISLAIF